MVDSCSYNISFRTFFSQLLENLENDHILIGRTVLDHVCMRVETLEKYDSEFKSFSKCAKLLSEERIGGRNIATFLLENPLVFADYTVDVIEIPQPKEDSIYVTGWEHAEFVLKDMTLEEFVAAHPKDTFKTVHMNRSRNPEVSITYDTVRQPLTAHFHMTSLADIIAMEKSGEIALPQ